MWQPWRSSHEKWKTFGDCWFVRNSWSSYPIAHNFHKDYQVKTFSVRKSLAIIFTKVFVAGIMESFHVFVTLSLCLSINVANLHTKHKIRMNIIFERAEWRKIFNGIWVMFITLFAIFSFQFFILVITHIILINWSS